MATQLSFTESLAGYVAEGIKDFKKGEKEGKENNNKISFDAKITVDDVTTFVNNNDHEAKLEGMLHYPPFGVDLPIENGKFNLFVINEDKDIKELRYEFNFSSQGKRYYFLGIKEIKKEFHIFPDPADPVKDIITLFSKTYEGGSEDGEFHAAGILRFNLIDLPRFIGSFDVQAANNELKKKAVKEFFGFALGSLSDTYLPMFLSKFDKSQKELEVANPWESNKDLGTRWKEEFLDYGTPELDGTREKEDAMFDKLAIKINEIQKFFGEKENKAKILRGQHAKTHLSTDKAKFHVSPDLHENLQIGFLKPGAIYPATVRFSNADSVIRKSDLSFDLRGVAIKVFPSTGRPHDFLVANAPITHTVDVRDLMIFAEIVAKRSLGPAKELEGDKTDIVKILVKQIVPINSLATEEYWSRAPMAFGEYAVKYKLAPKAEDSVHTFTRDLRKELKERLLEGDVLFDLQVQLYKNKDDTPIEDTSKEWKTPWTKIGELVISSQDIDAESAREKEKEINKMAFTPWNTNSDEFRPIGNMNRGRKKVYEASAKLRNNPV